MGVDLLLYSGRKVPAEKKIKQVFLENVSETIMATTTSSSIFKDKTNS